MTELTHPLVTGISWRFHWDQLQPAPGRATWTLVDRALDATHRAGKQAMLRVVSGRHTPAWVYTRGATPFHFTADDLFHAAQHPDDMVMPVPWDCAYLEAWGRFVQALGQRYADHPALMGVHVTGGGHGGEMHLPKARDRWYAVGLTDARLVATWQRLITQFQAAFPTQSLMLAIHEPLGRRYGQVLPQLLESPVPHEAAIRLQYNGLKADLPDDFWLREILRAAQTPIGYQLTGGVGWLEDVVGDRRLAFQHARDDGAAYVEVYARDVRDPALYCAFAELTGTGSCLETIP